LSTHPGEKNSTNSRSFREDSQGKPLYSGWGEKGRGGLEGNGKYRNMPAGYGASYKTRAKEDGRGKRQSPFLPLGRGRGNKLKKEGRKRSPREIRAAENGKDRGGGGSAPKVAAGFRRLGEKSQGPHCPGFKRRYWMTILCRGEQTEPDLLKWEK